jgi:chromosome segregation ATPase
VITLQSAMLVILGFSLAALLCCFLAPFYRRRAARLATEELKRSVPLTAAEISADKDRLRAEFAIKIHKLESKVEVASLSAARQLVEINRRDASISQLEGTLATLRTDLEEHENARRVLEQTITERLPKVEYRLGEAKQLLFQRDREITGLTQSSQKQAQALDEATQINTQQRDELHRANAALTTRAARNRDVRGDQRFDSEVALRAEIEALRAKTRDQAQLIGRMQGPQVNGSAAAGSLPDGAGFADTDNEVSKLRASLAEAERALQSASSGSDAEQSAQSRYDSEVRTLKATIQDQQSEVARLKAALNAYETSSTDERAINESKITLKARLSAMDAQATEQSATIQSLRAEAAAANEKLARQATHYMEEMRRLGAGTRPASGAPRAAAAAESVRRPLFDRISAPRVATATETGSTNGTSASVPEVLKPTADAARSTGFMNMMAGDASAPSNTDPSLAASQTPATAASGTAGGKPARRPGLLQRITGLEKPVA